MALAAWLLPKQGLAFSWCTSQRGESALEYTCRRGDTRMLRMLSIALEMAEEPDFVDCDSSSAMGGTGTRPKPRPRSKRHKFSSKRISAARSRVKKAQAAAKKAAPNAASAAAASEAERVSLLSAVANNLLDDAQAKLDEGESPDNEDPVRRPRRDSSSGSCSGQCLAKHERFCAILW